MRDLGWAGGSRLFELGQEFEYAVGAFNNSCM